MTSNSENTISPLRLRVGVLMIVIWWAPIWLLSPSISDYFNNSPTTAVITSAIVIIQTLIGLFGFYLAGKEIAGLLKHQPKKQALKLIWSILIHGHI